MKKEEAKLAAEVMLAYARGEEVQVKYKEGNDTWDSTSEPCWNFSTYVYRIKPTPKPPTYRPWKPEEVPMPCVLRHKQHPNDRKIILSIAPPGIQVTGAFEFYILSFKDLFEQCEYSLDNGKTWQPCGVLEADEN